MRHIPASELTPFFKHELNKEQKDEVLQCFVEDNNDKDLWNFVLECRSKFLMGCLLDSIEPDNMIKLLVESDIVFQMAHESEINDCIKYVMEC